MTSKIYQRCKPTTRRKNTLVTMTKSAAIVSLVSLWGLSLSLICLRQNEVQALIPTHNTKQCRRGAAVIATTTSTTTSSLRMASRENEIRRKIMKLKKEGKIKKDLSSPGSGAPGSAGSSSSYETKIKQKLGKRKSQLLGFSTDGDEEDDDAQILQIQAELDDDEEVDGDEEDTEDTTGQRQGRIGYLPELQQQKAARDEVGELELPVVPTLEYDNKNPIIDPSLFKEEEPSERQLSEEELLEKVAEKMAEKRRLEELAKDEQLAEKRKARQEQEKQQQSSSTAVGETKQTTTGVGGAWTKDGSSEESATTETYKPNNGGWGVFERPKDISKAFGGGRRIGPGYSQEDNEASAQNTKRLLKEYRRKVGIDVPSEKEHATEIEEALQIGQLAMQRGVYAAAVSALEKVTKWCSTNSPVGSKVFLELAMAYEAVGRSEEAIKVYQVLSQCRMEDVKYNAKRLLYGMEAMGLMREISSDFSRQKVKNTFIETTGLRDIAQNFDDRYNTAYVDLDNGFYKRLTESVVRSNREARQILLRATGKGEISRTRIVQALRSLARHFDDELENEIEANKKEEPTAFIDGKPLQTGGSGAGAASRNDDTASNLDDFVLSSPTMMIENLQGKWRLQLLADKTGDGVAFFNTTTATQEISDKLSYEATGPSGLMTTTTTTGKIQFEDSRRIITRIDVVSGGGGGFLGGLFGGGKDVGFLGAVSREQQIMCVDSVLMITKSPQGSRKGKDSEKEHFSVWRKVQDDTTLSSSALENLYSEDP